MVPLIFFIANFINFLLLPLWHWGRCQPGGHWRKTAKRRRHHRTDDTGDAAAGGGHVDGRCRIPHGRSADAFLRTRRL